MTGTHNLTARKVETEQQEASKRSREKGDGQKPREGERERDGTVKDRDQRWGEGGALRHSKRRRDQEKKTETEAQEKAGRERY